MTRRDSKKKDKPLHSEQGREMSSKKARRRNRQKVEEEERRRRKLNPATVFLLGIAAVVLLTALVAWGLGGPSGPGEPPWPGAVWSASHGHWH